MRWACASSSSVVKMQEEQSNNQATKNANHFLELIHYLSVVRNKHCLVAYEYNRAKCIQNLGWAIKLDLPDAAKEKLMSLENEYFGNVAAQGQMEELTV
ncbi:putative GINS complex, subunit Psf1, GINS subunit, domain A protein [Helianthus debilis subsp. tardiflorus]